MPGGGRCLTVGVFLTAPAYSHIVQGVTYEFTGQRLVFESSMLCLLFCKKEGPYGVDERFQLQVCLLSFFRFWFLDICLLGVLTANNSRCSSVTVGKFIFVSRIVRHVRTGCSVSVLACV